MPRLLKCPDGQPFRKITDGRLMAAGRLFWRKYLIFTIALFLIAVAVLMYLECRLGSDSLTVLLDGIHIKAGVAYSTASGLYNITLLVIGLLFARRYMGIGSVLYLFQIVLFIAICERIVPHFQLPDQTLLVRLIVLLAGQMFLSLGISLLICADFGMNTLDAILHQLADLTPVPYGWLRVGSDLLFVIVGSWMGGIIGIGTILSVVLTGTLIVLFRKLLEKRIIDFCNK